MDMRTDLTAVPHASLRNPNPEKSRKVLKNLGVCKRKWGQKRKVEDGERIEQVDGGPLTSADALALYQRLKTCRYAELIRLGIPWLW